MADSQIRIFLQPMQLLEWEHDPAPNALEDPTPDRLLKFLCALGLPNDVADFRARYREVSKKDQQLLLFPLEPKLVENLFDPLRQAKTSYLLGNYLSAIVLCGMVAEKVAILIHATNTPDESTRGEFERTGQARRVNILKERNLIPNTSAQAFGIVRAARRKYLHYWTSTRDDNMAKEAVQVYEATVQLVMNTLRTGFTNGKLTLARPIVEYLSQQGEFRPEQPD